MYDFEMKVKVSYLYEMTYEVIMREYDQRDGAYDKKTIKTERFQNWGQLQTKALEIGANCIKQVVEIKDMTNSLINEITAISNGEK